jgi:hypothetical protein
MDLCGKVKPKATIQDRWFAVFGEQSDVKRKETADEPRIARPEKDEIGDGLAF